MSRNLGIGVVIQQIIQSSSTESPSLPLGKTISNIALEEQSLTLKFTDGSTVFFADQGQSCCESRYMSCDDDLPCYVGAKFTGAELKEAPNLECDYDNEHEVQFLEIQTDRGVFTISNHNEHNGYYGGFLIKVTTER